MSADERVTKPATERGKPRVQRLKPNAVGLWGVMFMAVATAAPITAMVGNVPIAIGSGNGANAPAGYLVATIVLSLFALGYSAMAKHITSTGAFYGYISHGLGRVVGMAAGALTTLAYVVFEAALVGIFAFFASTFVSAHLGPDVNWIWFAVLMLGVNALLTYFDINITAKILGIFLITEILMLALMTGSILFTGGGPEGWSLGSLNPLNAFQNLDETVTDPSNAGATLAVAGSAGIGLFFAFWSWVGFESTAMYGEESREPKKIIPRATMLSVVCIGLFYVLVSWSAIVGTGPSQAVALAQDGGTAGQIFFGPVEEHLGHWSVILFEFLLMTGSYACGMAFHNCASRYIYAIGREDLIPGFGRTLGASHEKHGSPYIAGFVQTAIATLIVFWFFFTDRDPYGQLYALMAIMGTTAIMIVQALAAFACIAYFHVHKKHQETAHWFRTFLAPLIGGVGMLYVIWLLIENASFAAGAAASDIVFKSSPWVVAAVGLSGLLFALYAKRFSPERYEIIGRVVLEDTQERD
ncbi:amino acid transporter [Nocardioides daedukensis]|uniref:Amino acid transporter n=1 Tax=Nocardioides daedukensis TaxID=634462 RepID=A0A7Y9UNF8_9ACTN|nr:APC family permease [Nocardioides daedukensis]NYG57132.1 amino acid transporter [Nocardioides daedukensis]